MRMMRLGVSLLAVGFVAAARVASAAEVRCDGPYLRASELPHDDFSNYGALKRRVPKIASCDRVAPLDTCSVTDPWGYVDTFSAVTRIPEFTGPKERYLDDRTAHRSSKAQLPYGVRWSDSPAVVKSKLKMLKLEPHQIPSEQGVGIDLEVSGCGQNKAYVGFLTVFHFDKANLLTVKRKDHED